VAEKDPIRALDEATSEVTALEGALSSARERQREAVRVAHQVGMSIEALANRIGRHRNTVSEWCKD